jgi:hypothetical protein
MAATRRYNAASALKKLTTTSIKIVTMSRVIDRDALATRKLPKPVKMTRASKRNAELAVICPFSVLIILQE